MKTLKSVLRNWKTTLAGSGAVTVALVAWHSNPQDWKYPVGLLILGALGLFAKDSDKTGL